MASVVHCRIAALLIAIVCFALTGCADPTKPREMEWREDVLLPDGRRIVVERTEANFLRASWSGDASMHEIQRATLKFTGALSELPVWREPLMALVLYQDASTREWVMVATTNDCRMWQSRGRPKPPYWEFRINEYGWWQEVPLSQSSIGLRANLIYGPLVKGERHVTVTYRQKADSEAGGAARTYREVWGDPKQRVCGEGSKDH